MKRNIIGGAFTLASLMLAGHALAEDGVVHFVGEIVDTTCEVTSDTADQIVPLGKVSKNAFSGVGSLASPQKFSIKLENCPATYTQAAVRFDGTEAPGGDGDLKVGTPLTAGNPGDFTGTGQAIAATGVGIRIFNQSDNSQVKLYNDSAYTAIDAEGKAEMKFIARYVLMNPLMILVKIIKLRWIHILSYDQMVSRKINNQTTRCANSIFYTTLFTNSAPNYT